MPHASDVILEIGDKLFQRTEGRCLLNWSYVTMVAFSSFIVIANDPLSVLSIEQRILQPMQPFRIGRRQPPDGHLQDGAVSKSLLEINFEKSFGHEFRSTKINDGI